MKLLIWSVALAIAFFSTSVGKGAVLSQLPGFGSKLAAINHGVSNSTAMTVGVFQGVVNVKNPSSTNISFKTKEAMDAFFRQKVISVAEGALTNTFVDKDQPFKVYGITSRYDFDLGPIKYFYLVVEFRLIKSGDGSYHLPDFSSLELGLVDSMIVKIPGLVWARIEGRNNPENNPLPFFEEMDSRINPEGSYPPFDISTELEFIEVRSEYAIAGTSGSSLLKVSTVTKEGTNYIFRVYGSSGTQIPETPITTTNFKMEGEHTTFDIEGGDPGRVLMVQCASDLSGPWRDTGEMLVVRRYGVPLHVKSSCEGSTLFYRVRTVNIEPFWQ